MVLPNSYGEPLTATENEIRVTELSGVSAGSATQYVDSFLDMSLRQERNEGYRQAVRDMLSAIVPIAEQFFGQHPDVSSELRHFVYRFGESVEQHLLTVAATGGYVDGGLGI